MNRAHPQGSHRGGTPAGVLFFGDWFRWYRLLAQPPARIVTSLRLARWKKDFCRGLLGDKTATRRTGFTLLEMCIVLMIIAMLFGLSVPALHSAMTEQTVRRDSHQLALMVKTAMIQASEQHRAYAIELTATTMALHPVGKAAADADASSDDDSSDADTDASGTGTVTIAMPDVSVSSDVDPTNKLLAPDPNKADSWVPVPDGTEWIFQPGELCPATVVRVGHGDAWLQMTFDALTGNVDKETYSFP